MVWWVQVSLQEAFLPGRREASLSQGNVGGLNLKKDEITRRCRGWGCTDKLVCEKQVLRSPPSQKNLLARLVGSVVTEWARRKTFTRVELRLLYLEYVCLRQSQGCPAGNEVGPHCLEARLLRPG